MKRILTSMLLLLPLAAVSAPTSAKAWGWNMNYYQFGNSGYGQINGPRGYSGSYQQQRVGNTIYSNYRSPYGRTSCTTQYIGSIVHYSCN